MTKERANLGFGDELEDFNPTDWTPAPAKTTPARPSAVATRQAAQAAGFQSRESKPAAAFEEQVAAPRRRRTGRNVQLNLKARPETIEAYCSIADRMGWGLGETLERAVALLEREHGNGR